MAMQSIRDLFHMFGFVQWGDFADLTMYRNRKGKVVVFNKTWPEILPQEAIAAQKAKFKTASLAWQALSAVTRAKWEAVTKRLSLSMTGYNLWMSWQLKPDPAAMATLQRQSGIDLSL
jgi:hypothetical protein